LLLDKSFKNLREK